MRRKFKSKRRKNKKKIIFFLLILIILTISFKLNYNCNDKIIEYGVNEIKKKSISALKESFALLEKNNYNIENFMFMQTNGDNEIISVDFKVDVATEILSIVMKNMSNNLEYLNDNMKIEVPLGIITNSFITYKYGPKIPLIITMRNSVLGCIRTNIREFGLNNAIIELYMDIEYTYVAFLPIKSKSETITYSSLLASKMVSLRVPEFLSGEYNKKSNMIEYKI